MDGPIPVVLAILTRDHEAFLQRRPRGGPLPGEWEFPGGKVEAGEAPLDALRRELREELGLALDDATLFGVYSHVYRIQRKRVHYVLIAYHRVIPGNSLGGSKAGQWFGREALRDLPVLAGSRPIVEDLLRLWQVT